MHMETEWVTVYRSKTLDNSSDNVKKSGLTFTSGEKRFGFASIPYTAEELENATHHEELPELREERCLRSAVQ